MNALSPEFLESIAHARRLIRRGITTDELRAMPMVVQDAVCDEHRVELALVEITGRCGGNCTSDCLQTNHRGETVCRWTWRPCAVNDEMNQLIELFSTINQRGFQCQMQP